MSVDRLRAVLHAVGPPVDTVELAEMLWLAGHLTTEVETEVAASGGGGGGADATSSKSSDPTPTHTDGSGSAAGSDESGAANAPDEPSSSESSSETSSEPSPTTPPPESARPSPTAPKPPWALAAEIGKGDAEIDDRRASDLRTASEAVATPTAPMLSNLLAIQRALRPLKSRVPAPRKRVLDETATASHAADLPGVRPYRPVLTAADERWLSLALVLDTGPAMAMWRPLGRDLRDALLGLGAFRNLRVWHLADLESGVGVRTRPAGPALDPSALLDPAGRQVVLLLSDCSGPAWWSGRAQPALHRWASHGPTAIVQPMAEHLWRRTAVAPVAGRARTLRPGAPNTGLRFTPYDGSGFQPPATIPVPVLEIAPDWLADWARLITATGGPEHPTSVFHVGDQIRSRSEAVTAERELPIRERVQRFHATASPEAAELAAHVAVSVPVLPVMRLIQHRMVPGSGPAALAEVLLSGLFQPVDADRGVYGFVAGARSALLETLPRTVALATADVLTQLSAEIDRRAGSMAETFRSLLMSATATGEAERSAGLEGSDASDGSDKVGGSVGSVGSDSSGDASVGAARTFALVSQEALRLLSRRAAALVVAPPEPSLDALESPLTAAFDGSAGSETSSAPSRNDAQPTVVLVLGEVHVGLLPNSTSLPDTDVTRLLSIHPGQPVHTVHRPIRRAVSPELLESVACSLPSGSGRRVNGKGTTQTRVLVVGGIALLGSSQVRVASAPGSGSREWQWYLKQPGTMMVPGEIDPDDVAAGIRDDRRDLSRLDFGSIVERALDKVRRSALLDRQVLVRAGTVRVRWMVDVVASRSGSPVVDVAVERNGSVLTVRMVGRLDELPTMARFCEELALHEWLLLMLSPDTDLAGRIAAREPQPLAALRSALDLLLPLWMPPVYMDTDMRALWNALEERAALTREFESSVARIRDQISLWSAEGRFDDPA